MFQQTSSTVVKTFRPLLFTAVSSAGSVGTSPEGISAKIEQTIRIDAKLHSREGHQHSRATVDWALGAPFGMHVQLRGSFPWH